MVFVITLGPWFARYARVTGLQKALSIGQIDRNSAKARSHVLKGVKHWNHINLVKGVGSNDMTIQF
jgi:hypothetical protein